MHTTEYLDRLLLRYSGTFNIYKPYRIFDKEYAAYGYFVSHIEKYMLTREVNMWSTDSYEHILFWQVDQLEEGHLTEANTIFEEYMEPVLVRKNKPLPEENHMYSFMTIVILVQSEMKRELIKRIKKYRFEKGYKFNVRGFSQARFILVSLAEEKVYTNREAKKSKKLFEEVWKEVKEGKIGFEELCKKQGIAPFVQEEA